MVSNTTLAKADYAPAHKYLVGVLRFTPKRCGECVRVVESSINGLLSACNSPRTARWVIARMTLKLLGIVQAEWERDGELSVRTEGMLKNLNTLCQHSAQVRKAVRLGKERYADKHPLSFSALTLFQTHLTSIC